jgi:hypothetical protein
MILPGDMRIALPWVTAMLVCLLGIHKPAGAEERISCVHCAGPDQTYACHVMSEDSVPAEAARLFCMAQIAREHVHERCTVVRKASACAGLNVSYVYQDSVGDQPTVAETGPPDQKQEPTFADMTRATVEASTKVGKAVGDATIKAGKAVGDATKRSLKCLGSALNDC